MKKFVLVHGAWHGGWCWHNVAENLRARGFSAWAPTQTGLGERAHLLNAQVGLETFIEDICQVLLCEELHDVVLVGHSFAGLVIAGVADRMPERIAQLIFLDALIVPNGQSAMSVLTLEAQMQRRQTLPDNPLGMVLPAPALMGISDTAQAAWVQRRMTPHPLKAYLDPLRLEHPFGNGVPKHYIAVTTPWYAPAARVREQVKAEINADECSWQWHELAAGHDAMVTHPQILSALLEKISQM